MRIDHTSPFYSSRIISERECSACGMPLYQQPVRLVFLDSEQGRLPDLDIGSITLVVAVHELCAPPATVTEAFSGEHVLVAGAAWRLAGLDLGAQVSYQREGTDWDDPLATHARELISHQIGAFIAQLVATFTTRRSEPWPATWGETALPPPHETDLPAPSAATSAPPRRISRAEIDGALRRDALRRRAEAGDVTALLTLTDAEPRPASGSLTARFAHALATLRRAFADASRDDD